jgi:SAM-dependent methyltransferase
MKNLTEKEDWIKYWKSKPQVISEINKNQPFFEIIKAILDNNKEYSSVIELGGFPGNYSVLFKKYFNLDVTLIDQFIDEEIITNLLIKNGLKKGDVHIVEGDIFCYEPENKYDMVCSVGLVEHFMDTENIISHHVKLLKPGGTLLIAIPNFRGLNGLIQRIFDRENLRKHNLNSMKLKVLINAAKKNELKDIKVKYKFKFGIWLENANERADYIKAILYLIRLFGKFIRIVYPFNSRLFSTYIILTGKKTES